MLPRPQLLAQVLVPVSGLGLPVGQRSRLPVAPLLAPQTQR